MSEGTPVDRLFRVGYRAAYRAMRVYWAVARPNTHGALVGLWNAGRILLVRNSYVPYYSLPGGYVRRGETARGAAVRELLEEVGIRADAGELVPSVDFVHRWEGKHDHVEIFTLDIDEAPTVAVDHREVVAAVWKTPDEARGLDLFPPVWRHVIKEAHRRSPTPLPSIGAVS